MSTTYEYVAGNNSLKIHILYLNFVLKDAVTLNFIFLKGFQILGIESITYLVQSNKRYATIPTVIECHSQLEHHFFCPCLFKVKLDKIKRVCHPKGLYQR